MYLTSKYHRYVLVKRRKLDLLPWYIQEENPVDLDDAFVKF